jgi:glycosyltransferase involved in cell wall biosynthesis
MKVLILSWEYPPRNIGGLSTHVYNISHSLQQAGNDVHVVTCGNEGSPAFEVDKGVNVHRVNLDNINTENLIEWVNQLNYAMIETAVKLLNSEGKFDLIHAHDWHAAFAAKTLKKSYGLPLITTFHSTEYGRNNGIYSDLQRYIASVEAILAKESNKIICCSEYMKEQVSSIYHFDVDNIIMIPNGTIDHHIHNSEINVFRKSYAKDDEKLVLFIGRHVYQKGIQQLIEAVPMIVSKVNNIKFIISGTGPMTEELKYKAYKIGMSDKILFTGYSEEDEKSKLYCAADVLAMPSLYEPFGNVAVEAMSMGCPVVASETGGLSELITNNVNGKLFNPGSVSELANAIVEVLSDEVLRNNILSNARSLVKDNYTWEKASDTTSQVYKSLVVKKRKAATKKTTKKATAEDKELKTVKDAIEKKSEIKKTKRTTKKKAEASLSE